MTKQSIWKLSHGKKIFNDNDCQKLRNNQLAVVHGDTKKGQGENFKKVPIGTVFYLCHGNSTQLLGKFTSDAIASEKGDGWLQRSYKVIKLATKSDAFLHSKKNWTPRGFSTFWRVGEHDLAEFENEFLKPYFDMSLADLASQSNDVSELAEPIETPIQSDVEFEIANARKPFNRIYYGPPGTGKTFTLQKILRDDYSDTQLGRVYEFVTFHQSYGYEEFVEGLRPVLVKGKERALDNDGQVHYEIKKGAFLRLCDRARKNPLCHYAMVIDEINRGNISKIFGELITLIEVDKREGGEYPISVTLPYSGETFSVPSNIDVIGTMNTADRSLALVDTALRRRFEFVACIPQPEELEGIIVSEGDVDINITQLLEMMNRRIESLYDRDHTIGHAYFINLKEIGSTERFTELKTIFKNKIIPLLEEYFFEDWQKIRLVLGDNQKKNENYQFVREGGDEYDLHKLFGSNHDLDEYAINSRYQLNPDALNEPQSYIGIYDISATNESPK